MPAGPGTQLRRTRSALYLTLAALLVVPAAAARAAAPSNDAFADAQTVHVGDRATGTLVDATLEPGEPATSSEPIDHTIWFRLTTATSERVRMDTCGANPYSELAVFTGTRVDALTSVVSGEYGCTSGGRAYLDAVAGTTYYVRVSGYSWGAAVALTVARPQVPPNDDFANAQAVGVPADVSGTNVDATVQPGEPDPITFGSGHSVWYRLTPTTADAVLISLADCADAAGLVSTLTVYTGDSLGALTEVGEFAPACGYRAKVVLFPKAGTTYRIAVRGGGHAADAFTLRVGLVPSPPDTGPPTRPPNPKCPFELAAPGSITYRGTHSGGGEVCVTLTPDFSGISWFTLVDPPRDLCIPWAVERFEPALPIVARRFSATTSWSRVTGTFAGRSVSGTYQAPIPLHGGSVCSGRVIAWTASTQATPPPALSDATPPALRVRGATAQHPLRSGRIAVRVRCPDEACAASASATVAGVRLSAAPKPMRANVATSLTLRLSTAARRAIRKALRSRRSIHTRVAAVATDVAGNAVAKGRTITLRR